MQASRDIGERLLTGQVNLPTRYTFEIVKEITSEKYQLPVLSDIEIIAYFMKEDRAKAARLTNTGAEGSSYALTSYREDCL